MNKKLFLIIFIVFFTFILNANEKTILNKNRDSFNFSIEKNITYNNNSSLGNSFVSDIKLYSLSETQKQKAFLIMGISGSVILGTSIFFITPGIVMLAVSVVQYEAPYAYRDYFSEDAGYNLWLSGLGFLISGSVLFLAVGLPLAIAGFVLYYHYGGRFSLFLDQKDKYSRLGFAVKF